MPTDVSASILAFTVRMISRFARHDRTVRFSALAMFVDVLHADHHTPDIIPPRLPLDGHHSAVPDVDLAAMITDPQPHSEPEGRAEPVGSLVHIVKRKLRDDGAIGAGGIAQHSIY